jgi:hypothetical protein
MLLNLSDNFGFTAKDHSFGGIDCNSESGPSFGNSELLAYPPLLGEENLRSFVGCGGF